MDNALWLYHTGYQALVFADPATPKKGQAFPLELLRTVFPDVTEADLRLLPRPGQAAPALQTATSAEDVRRAAAAAKALNGARAR